ncbi:hypothetical protein Bca52824_077510 [Brassica carinata]|uniref:Uncharacterized protein n=1 Tax=Brassica carinata TaxID=52824 RepID=A0A8X7U035_BRACI|nr:hypothetical protein Bca52824_077510 [Brassica carinata]
MAGLQYSFFPTDFFYPRASPPATSLVAAATPNLKITQKRDDSVVVDKTIISSSRWFSPVLASRYELHNGTCRSQPLPSMIVNFQRIANPTDHELRRSWKDRKTLPSQRTSHLFELSSKSLKSPVSSQGAVRPIPISVMTSQNLGLSSLLGAP